MLIHRETKGEINGVILITVQLTL